MTLRFLALLLFTLCALPALADKASQQQQGTSGVPGLRGYTMTPFQIGDLMGKGEECMTYNWMPDPAFQNFCCLGKDPLSANGCEQMKMGSKYHINYREPSAIVEVSCRSGYSMLTPGQVPPRSSHNPGKGVASTNENGAGALQTCSGFNKPGNSHWFFEARVWAINGYDGGLRHQAMGGTNGERARQCSEVGTDTFKTDYWGYGAQKWGGFDHSGAGNGPGGSWKAYVSDEDPAWLGTEQDYKHDWGALKNQSKTKTQPCKGTSVENCWGPLTEVGHVTHPNPVVAAALVALRAHTKARSMNKVSSDLGAGYQMSMDFPFPGYSGAHASSMGRSGNDKTGSDCFNPGDPGPSWYKGQSPQELVKFIENLKPGENNATTDMNSGIYVFTFWVETRCERWTVTPPGPAGICQYVDKSGS